MLLSNKSLLTDILMLSWNSCKFCLFLIKVVIHLFCLFPVQYAKDTKQIEAMVICMSMYVYFLWWSTPIVIILIITVDGVIIFKSNSDDQSLQQYLKFSILEAFHLSPIKVIVCWLNTDWRLKECLLEVYRYGKYAFSCHLIFFFQNIAAQEQPSAYISRVSREGGVSTFLFFIMAFSANNKIWGRENDDKTYSFSKESICCLQFFHFFFLREKR